MKLNKSLIVFCLVIGCTSFKTFPMVRQLRRFGRVAKRIKHFSFLQQLRFLAVCTCEDCDGEVSFCCQEDRAEHRPVTAEDVAGMSNLTGAGLENAYHADHSGVGFRRKEEENFEYSDGDFDDEFRVKEEKKRNKEALKKEKKDLNPGGVCIAFITSGQG